MTPEALNALADRVGREEPSRLLDADIFEAATGRRDFNKADKSFRECGSLLLLTDDDRLNWVYAPAYTTSLDAAVTLVPEEYAQAWSAGDNSGEHQIFGRLGYEHEATGLTPAAALTAAALRARAALLTDGAVPSRTA